MAVELVVGTYDCTMKGFSIDPLDPQTGLCKKYQEKVHSGCVKAVASGGHYLATGGTDEVIKLYDMRRHTEIGTLLQHNGSITWLCFFKDKLLLSASEDGCVCVWRCGGGWDLLHILTGHKYGVSCVAVHPSGKLTLSVGKDRILRMWDLKSGNGIFSQRLKKAAELVSWNSSGDQYVLSYGEFLLVHEVKSGNTLASIEVGKQINSVVYVRQDVLAVGSEHPSVLLYSTLSGDCLARLEGHTKRVKALCVCPVSGILFSASSDETIRVWRLANPLPDAVCVNTSELGSRVTCMAITHETANPEKTFEPSVSTVEMPMDHVSTPVKPRKTTTKIC
ncbi:p21-activated protein kinase-interacting protein 1-like isoform X2 [Halichondria panicea]|uniref:p21-activated protein kinase-interacting protein 1-like isoform X2 n=1 Tax=Halichondria panicea TaxID=6063 RepID=UPI00312B387F